MFNHAHFNNIYDNLPIILHDKLATPVFPLNSVSTVSKLNQEEIPSVQLPV